MSNVLRLEGLKPFDALALKYELIKDGLELNKDFAWTWFAPSTHGKSAVEFYFMDAKYVSFYTLKWS